MITKHITRTETDRYRANVLNTLRKQRVVTNRSRDQILRSIFLVGLLISAQIYNIFKMLLSTIFDPMPLYTIATNNILCASGAEMNIMTNTTQQTDDSKPTEVIEYSIFMRAGAKEIVSRKCGHGCVNDYERMLCDSVAEEDYYDIAEMNLQCACNGGQWYPHLWNPSQRMKDMGVVMPGGS